ncbi:MAG: 50S ribosomal protein L21 [bacterium (Candidatus Ratteibacteria) CG23_combo_of_CG06-09_8_20_14_all_48_7]|uniref:Large ribosomal subunit protein bL21 n=1 Tax=bacterium (Candidatus Ratteibacteria) CG23_combo_of_CG06-09_8_20_14_all_48_7 TaxID=2014292 RepID=A0A2G9Y8S3_9BACT|nr:MAG: 50S ribosomal protein L21 [bacterium (Candidatus Ratteibacteria) CG23_combo_of_CG06-09_8_20_14_all_48_7]
MYAVIETGGKQYRVSTGTKLKVEKLPVSKGGEIIFDRVLLFVSDKDEVVADPAKLSGIKVKAKVIEEGKNKKILVFKRKSKKDYKKAFGHRQPYSLVMVQEIGKEVA